MKWPGDAGCAMFSWRKTHGCQNSVARPSLDDRKSQIVKALKRFWSNLRDVSCFSFVYCFRLYIPFLVFRFMQLVPSRIPA